MTPILWIWTAMIPILLFCFWINVAAAYGWYKTGRIIFKVFLGFVGLWVIAVINWFYHYPNV